MRTAFALAATAALVCTHAAAAQAISDADAHRFAQELQVDHIRANVPDEPVFSRLLQRDLKAYFAGKGFRNPAARFELLRRAPTQSGVAYPKFYLWVSVRSSDGRLIAGVVRVAAVERQRFDVTDFLSAQEIRAEPSRVEAVVPEPLVQGIIDRVAGQDRRGG